MRFVVGLLVVSGVAFAQPKTKADETFEKGRALMAAKDYAGACKQFEGSLALDFQFGTLYNIAECDTKIGKLASAIKAYQKIARDDFNQTRRASAAKAVEQLRPRVPTVTITLRPAGVVADTRLDAIPVDDLIGKPIPLDLGEHVITSNGISKTITARESEELAITMELPVNTEVPVVAKPPVRPTPEPGRSNRAVFGISLTVGGGAVVVGGLVLGAVALHDWNSAKTTSMYNVAVANDQVRRARIVGDFATAATIVGVAATATGIYLWRTSHGATISPQVGADGGGVTFAGTF